LKTEAAHNFIRIIANYARLGIGLALGLLFVPFTLKWIGNDGLGLIILLGAGSGLAGMFREITNRAAVRELAAAMHSGDEDRFRTVFNSSLVVSALAAGIATVLFIAVALAIPLLNIPAHLIPAGRILIASQGAYLVIATLLSPIFNMLIVREHFVSYNLWSLLERCGLLISAVLLAKVFKVTNVAQAIAWMGILCAALNLVTFLIPVIRLIASDPRLLPNFRFARRASVLEIFSTLKWYVVVETASSLHERVGQFIVAHYFTSSVGSNVWGIALQFVSYVRQATQGVTFGLDSVAARLSKDGPGQLKALIHHSTRMHGLVAIPAGLTVFVLADPLIHLWIGTRIQNPDQMLPAIITTVKIMGLALTGRAISDGWMMILYGAGHIRRYAPLVLMGGIANPVLSVLLIVLLPKFTSLPAPLSTTVPPQDNPLLLVPPLVFCAVFTAVHFFILPAIAARCLSIRYRDLFIPLWRPAVASALSAPVLFFLPAFLSMRGVHSLLMLVTTGIVFAAIYGAAAGTLVLTATERERFVWSRIRRFTQRQA